MKNNKLARQLALLSAATLVSVAAQNVSAHTGIRDVVQEGLVSYNAVNITHGCATNAAGETATTRLDVIASSALFPNAADPTKAVVTKLDPVTGASLGTLADLSGDIVGSLPGVGFTNLGLGLVQPGLFPNFIPKVDTLASGSLLNRGFAAHNGPKPYDSAPIWQSVASTSSLAPFRVGPVAFKTDSCALNLKVRVAAANWCLKGNVNNTNPARADVWIGHMTAKFNDSFVMPYNQADMDAGKFYWPTMTITRNLVTNPLPAGCGAGYNLAIEPSDADIDANLPIPHGPAPTGAPQVYWPSGK
ncbi:MAG: hypothetical protein PHU14_13095 [Methylovulum sp.]|nr:hypothetical protein [Methylovulum sp.]